MALTVWGRRSSFNLQKVMWLVGELGIAHTHIPAGGDFGGLDTPTFLAMNPHGRVPVIDDGGTVVWESHAILRYLAATYGAGTYGAATHGAAAHAAASDGRGHLWSDDPAERSLSDRWMDWAQCSLQPDFLMGVFWGFYRTPEHLRDMGAVSANIARCAGHMQLLDRILANRPFLAGERFTLADIPAGTALYRYFSLAIDRPSVPNVEAWYERLQQRPAYRAHVMVPFEDLQGKLDY